MKIVVSLLFTGFLALTACLSGAAEPTEPPPLDSALQSTLSTWLAENGQAPKEYVLSLFSDHDVVFLGEHHRIKHDLVFVQSLIKPLYEAGVMALATEFGRREDQPLIDSLLNASEWDETLAREIVFRQFVFWGYQEYVDVYRSAWSLNQELPDTAQSFRILGINDSPDWSFIKTDADRDDGAIKTKVWRGGGEGHWADVILKAVDSGHKVLVHCGIHHAFTEYRQPIVSDGEFKRFDSSPRCGNHVFAAIGKRAVTVFMHAPWSGAEGYNSPTCHPADGIIDALMLADGPRPVGFDIDKGPFGELSIKNAVYRHGYDDFRLADFCDGWIYRKPICEYEGVTPISGWVNEQNLEHARAQSWDPRYRQASIEQFNEGIAWHADITRGWGHLR